MISKHRNILLPQRIWVFLKICAVISFWIIIILLELVNSYISVRFWNHIPFLYVITCFSDYKKYDVENNIYIGSCKVKFIPHWSKVLDAKCWRRYKSILLFYSHSIYPGKKFYFVSLLLLFANTFCENLVSTRTLKIKHVKWNLFPVETSYERATCSALNNIKDCLQMNVHPINCFNIWGFVLP